MARGKTALIQTGLRLEPEIADRLRQGGLSLPNEIRDRLERTFKEDAIDPVTRELRDGLVNIAARLRQDFGTEWHTKQRPYEAFVAAIMQRLAGHAPPIPDGVGATDLLHFGPEGPPETIGRLRESDDRREHPYPHLEANLKRKHGHRVGAARRGARKEGDNG